MKQSPGALHASLGKVGLLAKPARNKLFGFRVRTVRVYLEVHG